MPIAVSEQPAAPPDAPLDDETLAHLARTFDDALQSVWIHASDGRCVYANPRAGKGKPGPGDQVFELLNPSGQVIGRIHTNAA